MKQFTPKQSRNLLYFSIEQLKRFIQNEYKSFFKISKIAKEGFTNFTTLQVSTPETPINKEKTTHQTKDYSKK